MQARAWLLPLLMVALPLASAGYGDEGQIEADPGVALEGLAETWLPSGIASYVGGSTSEVVGVRLASQEANIRYVTIFPACATIGPGPGLPTTGPCSGQGTEHINATDLSVTVTKPLSAYTVLVTTDRTYADTPAFGSSGQILTTTVGGALSATAENLHITPTDREWVGDSDQPIAEPIYQVTSSSARLDASRAAVTRATGGFELFLQGVEVPVRGTDTNGKAISRTFDTRVPSDDNDPVRFLVIEVSDADLQMSAMSPFHGFAPADERPVTDIRSSARFTDATGTIDYADKDDRTLANEDVTLAGPVSITLTKLTSGEAPRATYTIVDGLQLASMEDLPTDDESIPPAALAAASAGGAAGAGGLIALAYFWPRLKFWATLMLLPLYTRIERDAVLEHEKRDELYELIRQTPGIHAHEIGEKANIGWGTTVYHLKLLENHGLIVSKKSGRYKRFFVNTGEYTKKKEAYGALRNETAKAVAQYIVDHPGTTQKEMCAALGIQPSLASWHVEKLEGVELVKRVKDGRMVRYFAGPAWQELNVRVSPLGGGDTPAET